MTNKDKKVIRLQKELDRAKRFETGISWYQVIAINDEVQEIHVVADELGEDCNAYDLRDELKAMGFRVTSVSHLKDVIF